MQFVIMGMLWSTPLSLYEIRQRFTQVVSLFYSASFGSIQRSLRILVEQGHLTVSDAEDSARGKKLYALTDEGREAWSRWMTAPLSDSDLEREMLARIFFLGRIDDSAARGEVLAAVRARIESDRRRLDALAGASAGASGAPAEYQLATLDYGLRSLDVALDWVSELADAEAAR